MCTRSPQSLDRTWGQEVCSGDMDPLLGPAAKTLNPTFIPCLALFSSLNCFMGSLAPDSCHLTGSRWLYSVERWERARWARSLSRQDAIPSSWACVLLQCLPVLLLPQHDRICLRLIRRRQDSQGRTSECSDASAAVVELSFLISSLPLRCQESGLPQYGLSHCPSPFYLIKPPSIT